jgi:divalent metal cation (Fe/Co/Zn/Cd) transporter
MRLLPGIDLVEAISRTTDSSRSELHRAVSAIYNAAPPALHNGLMTAQRMADTARLIRRGLLLEYTTLSWNVVGTVVVVTAAVIARSVALAGFGLDSLIEILASVVVVWQLKGAEDHHEHIALRMIAGAFFALSVYIVLQLAVTLFSHLHPSHSLLGIIWLAATLLAMLLLAYGKRVTGQQLDNVVLSTEAHVTLIDAYLAAAVLLGLALNQFFDWWWADPIAALIIVYYAMREGLSAWHESHVRV